MASQILIIVSVLAIAYAVVTSFEPSPLQDFCVADPTCSGFASAIPTTSRCNVFVFPVGLVHFQRNGGQESAFSISYLSSQNPGVLLVANTLFGSAPSIPNDILAKAFRLDKSEVEKLQAQS